MAKMKTEFELEFVGKSRGKKTGRIFIMPPEKYKVTDILWVKTDNPVTFAVIPDKNLERFAVNILKAIGSKKLK